MMRKLIDRRAFSADCKAVQRDLEEAVTSVKNEAGIITERCATGYVVASPCAGGRSKD